MKYPVLCLPNRAGAFLAVKSEDLTTTRVSDEWTDQVITGMRIVDSSGSCFIVRSYEVEKPKMPVLRKVAQVLELRRELKLNLEPTPPLPFAEVKAVVLRSIEEDPEGFEESSGMETDWWQQKLSQASTSREVLSIFAKAAGAA